MVLAFKTEYLDTPAIEGRVCDFFYPECDPLPLSFFFIHGGGWRSGSRVRFHRIIERLVGRGHPCASTDYRLKGSVIGDQLSDIRHSYARFLQMLKQVGSPLRVVVFGSSAGGHLALLFSLAKEGVCADVSPQAHDLAFASSVRPAGVVVQAAPVTFEPWDDIVPSVFASMQDAVGISFDENPDAYRKVSPLYHIDGESPPAFLMNAENEHMFPLYLTHHFCNQMHGFDRRCELKTYANAEHGFFYDVGIGRWQQEEAFEDLVAFGQSL